MTDASRQAIQGAVATKTVTNGVKKEQPKDEEEEELFWGSDDEDEEEDNHFAMTRTRIPKKDVIRFGEILAEPIPKRYTCEALIKMIDKGQIDLEPEYQRGIVWKADKQSAVIDSIFRNCYVPPILFSIHTQENEDGDINELRICVDGKQRLTSIHKFMTNEIPLREPETNRAFFFRPRGRGKCLTESQREKFCQINMNCIEYHGLDEERERDMFQRVQMGVTLTPAERISANLGAWPDFIRQLVKRFVENEDFNIRHLLATDRGRDFMYMTMITLLILNCGNKNYVPSTNAVTKFLKVGGAPTEIQKKSIIAALTKMTVLSNDYDHNTTLLPVHHGHYKKPISPVEFVFASYMCFRFPQTTNAQMAELIKGMMIRVRGEHSDVFINVKVEKTLRNYINEMEHSHPFWLSAARNGDTAGRKRRRDGENDDDEEWTPGTDRMHCSLTILRLSDVSR